MTKDRHEILPNDPTAEAFRFHPTHTEARGGWFRGGLFYPRRGTRRTTKSSRPGKGQDEVCAAAGVVENGNGSAMGFHDALADAQAKTVATGLAGAGPVDAIERLEDVGQVGFGNAGTVVGDADGDGAGVFADPDFDRAAVGEGKLAGVFEQVPQHGPDLLAIDVQPDFGRRQAQANAGRTAVIRVGDFAQERRKVLPFAANAAAFAHTL